jgi:hypothetical protein
MKINEVTNIKPKTTQQLRVDSLKRQKENISKQLKAERNRQKISKAQQTIADLKNQH